MIRFNIIDSPDQQFSILLGDQRATVRLRWNLTSETWSIDFALDDVPVMTGRRITAGTNLLAQLRLNIGAIFGLPVVGEPEATRQSLVNGNFRLYYATQAELDSRHGTSVSS